MTIVIQICHIYEPYLPTSLSLLAKICSRHSSASHLNPKVCKVSFLNTVSSRFPKTSMPPYKFAAPTCVKISLQNNETGNDFIKKIHDLDTLTVIYQLIKYLVANLILQGVCDWVSCNSSTFKFEKRCLPYVLGRTLLGLSNEFGTEEFIAVTEGRLFGEGGLY